MISGLRPLSPLWCLRHHLPPRESVSLDSRASKGSLRIQFPCHPAKAGALWILSNVPHSSEGNRRANLPLRGRRRRRRQKGCISIARRAVCLFSTGEARLYGFAAGRRHTKWRRQAPYLPSGAVLYNSRGRNPQTARKAEPIPDRTLGAQGRRPGGAINPRGEVASTFGNTVKRRFLPKSPTPQISHTAKKHQSSD